MSRLDGREREAGDGEGAGEKDSRRNPDTAQVVPCHVGAATCLGKSAGQASKGAGGCSRCLVPDSWTETYLGRQTRTVKISRSVEYLYDKSPASLLGQACGLAGGMGKPQLIFFNRRRYCMQRDPCRWQLCCGQITVRRSVGSPMDSLATLVVLSHHHHQQVCSSARRGASSCELRGRDANCGRDGAASHIYRVRIVPSPNHGTCLRLPAHLHTCICTCMNVHI